jgi:hypothetical protein
MIINLADQVLSGNDGISPTGDRIVTIRAGSDMLADLPSGATGAIGRVKLVKLANGPTGPFMPRPKESKR